MLAWTSDNKSDYKERHPFSRLLFPPFFLSIFFFYCIFDFINTHNHKKIISSCLWSTLFHFLSLFLSPSHHSLNSCPSFRLTLQRQINVQATLLSFCLASLCNRLGLDDAESLMSQSETCKSRPATRQNDTEWKRVKRGDLSKNLIGPCRGIVFFAARPISTTVLRPFQQHVRATRQLSFRCTKRHISLAKY